MVMSGGAAFDKVASDSSDGEARFPRPLPKNRFLGIKCPEDKTDVLTLGIFGSTLGTAYIENKIMYQIIYYKLMVCIKKKTIIYIIA